MAQVIKIEIPVEVTDKTDPALSDIKNDLKSLDESAKSVKKSMETVGKSSGMSGFERSYQKIANSMKKFASAGKQKYQAVMEVKDMATPIISKISSGIKGVAGKAWNITMKVGNIATAPLRAAARMASSPLAAAGVSLSAGAAVASSVSTFAGFESQMSKVAAISGATQEELTQLTAKAKEMGATTKFTAQEAGEGFEYMAMAGWKTSDMMSGISGILNLAAASGESLGTTSDIVTDALTAFGLKASDSTHFSDVLAAAASNANTTVSGMGDTFKYAGSMAGSLGYSIEDIALATGLMANTGIKGTMAGTALNSIMTRLATNTSGAADTIRGLGVEFYNADGTARDFSDVMGDLRKATAGMNDEQKSAFANTVAGLEAQKGLLAILNASEQDYNKLSDAISNADGASQRMSNTMLDNLSGKFTLFKSALDGVKIALGERFQPYLMDALEWVTKKMPDFQTALMNGMDRVEDFVTGTKEKISAFTSSSEWQSAGFFGKMEIAWDELIADPFAEWWSGRGKGKMESVAKDIGLGLGTGISAGILTLLGIDVSETLNEGVGIGKKFAAGFAEGFEGLKVKESILGALGGTVSGLFSNAGALLPGGQSAGITSWLSAGLLAKAGIPLLKFGSSAVSAGSGLFKVGKKILGTTGGGSVDEGIGDAVDAASTGVEAAGLVQGTRVGTGLLGLFGRAGTALGSGATTAGGLAAAGGAAVLGGVAGAASLFSAGKNMYTAVKTSDNDERAANIGAATLKGVGVGGGAALGAAIGSVVPGIGTAVGALAGAGIGGLLGMFGGNKAIENYETRKQAAEEAAAAEALMAEKSKYALEGARFENEKLADAMKDTSVSAAEFGSMMQEAASQKIQDSFGNISLSMQEIQDAAKQIAFRGDDAGLGKFAAASSDAESSLNNLQSAVSSMDKLNWKAGMGLINDSASAQQYQAGIQNMISGAKQYVEDQHYQATAAIDLLVEPGNPVDMTSGLNTFYADIQNQLNGTSEQLTAKMNIALEDGVITMDEQAELSNLQSQLTEITSTLTDAQSEASMQSLKIKYSGAELDASSFASLTSELQSQVQESVGQYDDALEIALTNLNLQLESGAISQDQFDAQFQAITEGYQAKIQDLSVNVESFQLDTIADAFGSQLDGILPDLEGSVAERLGQAMHNAMESGVDVENWDVDTASKWLGLEGLSGETQAALTDMMSQVAATMPDNLVSAMGESGGMGEAIQESLTSSIDGVDLSGVAESLNNSLGDAMSGLEVDESGGGLSEGIQNSLTSSFENMDLSGVAESLNASLGNAMSSLDMGEAGSGLQEGIQNSIIASFEGMDLSGVGESLSASLNEALAGMGGEGIDMSGFGEALSSSISASVEGLDYSGITSAVGSGVGSAIEASIGQIQGSISNLYSQVGSAVNAAFAAGFQTTTTVTITVNYQLANPTATISFSGGGTGTATVSASISAEGGFSDGPELTWWGEDGPEVIIPLGGKRRSRGLELWRQAGKVMGINTDDIPGHADGGFIGVSPAAASGGGFDDEESISEDISPDSGGQQTSGSGPVIVNLTVNPSFEVSGANDESILNVIKSRMRELADELADEISDALSEAYENTPVLN